MSSRPIFLTHAILAGLLLAAFDAGATDVVITPASGSSLVVKDTSGSIDRLRVNEGGNVWIPVLATGAQQNTPVCSGSGGLLGPCAPATGSAFTLPYAQTIANPTAAFAITNTGGDALNGFTASAGNSGVFGQNTGGGKGVFGVGSSGNGVEGGSTSGSGVKGETAGTSGQSGAAGVWGDSHDFYGVWGTSVAGDGVHGQSTTASGVYGLSGGAGVWGESTGYDAVHGHTSNPNGNTSGVAGFGDGGNTGVFGISTNGTGVSGTTASGTGVFGHSNSGFGMATDGHAKQVPGMFGWVKAMVNYSQISGFGTCFNSQASGAQINTPPCGFTFSNPQSGFIQIHFGFDVSHSLTLATGGATAGGLITVNNGFCGAAGSGTCEFPSDNNTLFFAVYDASGNLTSNDDPYGVTIVVF